MHLFEITSILLIIYLQFKKQCEFIIVMNIKNLFHDKRYVGRTVKSSKIYYVWEFVLEGKLMKVELFQSVVSGKKKLVLNGNMLTEEESYSADFIYQFSVKQHLIEVEQKGLEKFEMVIDKKSFKTLLDDEASKTYLYVANDDKVIEDFIHGGKSKMKEVEISKRNSVREQIPNFFDDNDFDFGHNTKKGNSNKKEEKSQSILNTKSTNNDFRFSNQDQLGGGIIEQPKSSGNKNEMLEDIFGILGSSAPKETQQVPNSSNNFQGFDFSQSKQNTPYVQPQPIIQQPTYNYQQQVYYQNPIYQNNLQYPGGQPQFYQPNMGSNIMNPNQIPMYQQPQYPSNYPSYLPDQFNQK